MATPVDTGALRASIYTVTSKGSGRQDSIGQAEALYWKGKGEPSEEGMPLLPEIPLPPDELTAFVAVGMEYGPYVEYGTDRMAARPYLVPAAERNRTFFLKEIEKAIKDAGTDAGWRP